MLDKLVSISHGKQVCSFFSYVLSRFMVHKFLDLGQTVSISQKYWWIKLLSLHLASKLVQVATCQQEMQCKTPRLWKFRSSIESPRGPCRTRKKMVTPPSCPRLGPKWRLQSSRQSILFIISPSLRCNSSTSYLCKGLSPGRSLRKALLTLGSPKWMWINRSWAGPRTAALTLRWRAPWITSTRRRRPPGSTGKTRRSWKAYSASKNILRNHAITGLIKFILKLFRSPSLTQKKLEDHQKQHDKLRKLLQKSKVLPVESVIKK